MSAQYSDVSNSSTDASSYSDLDQFYSFRPPVGNCMSTVKIPEREHRYFNEHRKTNMRVNASPYRSDYDNLSGRSPMKLSNCSGEQMYQIRNVHGQSEEQLEHARMRIANTYPHLMTNGYNSGYFTLGSAYEDR